MFGKILNNDQFYYQHHREAVHLVPGMLDDTINEEF